MNIKSLLIGSAALATASTGALAADAIVMPEPEPMEYVRICDVYGVGFFYIPGTETCLKLGGYMRYEIQYNTNAAAGANALTKLARFQSTFDVRSDTEVGTIRGFAAINFDYQVANRVGIVAGAPAVGAGYGVDVGIDQAYIQVIRGSHQWLFGREARPYARFQGYGFFTINGGTYSNAAAFRPTEISYTFAGSNGFNFVAAVTSTGAAGGGAAFGTRPNFEIGVRFDRGWGSIGAMAGYDWNAATFGAKAWTRVKFGNSGVSGALAVFYSSGAGAYSVGAPFSVLAGLQARFSPKVAGNLHAQWFSNNTFDAAANLDFTVAKNFNVIPEVRYNSATNFGAVVRLTRAFGS